ncbi:MAG: 2-hydroxychromene-2-carboxylate isomerase [Paracoccaceae bacterium]
MDKKVEFFFDVISPAAYIAWNVIPKIASTADAELVYRPFFLGGVMKAAGNQPPGTIANKGKWMATDLPRWAALYQIPYKRNEKFPQMTLSHMRGAIAMQGTDQFHPYCDTLFKALHVDNRDIEDQATVIELLTPLGLATPDFMAKISDQAVKDELKANTEEAVERGAFGAPTFFVGENMHFGQDRLFMVAEDLGISIHEALDNG